MTLDECLDGTEVFVDANIAYYHFVDVPPFSDACTAFLSRAGAGAIRAYATPTVLADAVHKVMLAEAASLYGLPRAGLVRHMREHPDLVRSLRAHEGVVPEMERLGIRILPVEPTDLHRAAGLSRAEGLLTGDAIIIAAMQHRGLTHLATNDGDFERLSWLTCYLPR